MLAQLALDQRALGVARPVDEPVGIGGADLGELSGEVDVAARVAFAHRHRDAVLLAGLDERVEAALAEVVIHVDEAEALELRELLGDEVGEVGDELAVGNGAAEHPLVALSRDALRGAAHHDLRHLLLAKHLRRGEARRAAHAAHGNAHVVARGEAPRDHPGFLGLAGVVADDKVDLPAEHAAGGVARLHHHLDAGAQALSLRCRVAADRPEGADLDRPRALRPRLRAKHRGGRRGGARCNEFPAVKCHFLSLLSWSCTRDSWRARACSRAARRRCPASGWRRSPSHTRDRQVATRGSHFARPAAP